MKKPSLREKGFTMVELLVVVAILGVMASIVVPNVSKFIGSGKSESGKTEVQIMVTAVNALLADAEAAKLDAALTTRTNDFTAGGSGDVTATNISGNVLHLASYLQNNKTKYWYTITQDGKVTGYWKETGANMVIGVNPSP